MDKQCILVLSCDKYRDLWDPFFEQFISNWPDCPYPIYLGVNEAVYDNPRVITIRSGIDKNWSTSLKTILKQVKEDFILLWIEDIFILSPVDEKKVAECFRLLKDHNANHIHIHPIPKPDAILDGFGLYEKGMPYRVTVVGFWNKAYLSNLLIDGESPWNFEIMGSYRTSYDDGFYCSMTPICEWMNLVEKGMWIHKSLAICQDYNIPLNLYSRDFSIKKNVQSFFFSLFFNLVIRSIPWKLRLFIMNLIRKILICY